MAFAELKQRQSVMWGTGPYQRVTETIAAFELIAEPDPRSSTAFPDFRQMPAASAVTFGRPS